MVQDMRAMSYSDEADELRAFSRDELQLPHHDVGGGRLIFDVPEGRWRPVTRPSSVPAAPGPIVVGGGGVGDGGLRVALAFAGVVPRPSAGRSRAGGPKAWAGRDVFVLERERRLGEHI